MILIFKNPYQRIYLLILEKEEGEGGGRERNIDVRENISVREKHQLAATPMCPNWGLNFQPRYVP